MKRFLFLVIALSAFLSSSYAQEDKRSEQALQFIYIVHDHTTPLDDNERLIGELDAIVSNTIEFGQVTVICLSNGILNEDGNNWLLAEISEDVDNLDVYNKIKYELKNMNSHEFSIADDVEFIVNLFNDKYEFLDENGDLYYESVTFDFYLTSKLCDDEYADDFIVPLYLAFDVPNLQNKPNFDFNIMVGTRDNSYTVAERIFGDKNYNGINEETIMLY